MSASIPYKLKDLRACKVCSLIKTFGQFFEEGCENCEDFLHLRGNEDRIFDCTSANFNGMIALTDPSDSWVARWQQINHCVRGIYAISVSGELPEPVKRSLIAKNIFYKNRDFSQRF